MAPAPPSEKNPLARLVLVMVCLSIAGSILAGAHYYAVDLPQQKNIPAPQNALDPMIKCKICKANCAGSSDYYQCLTECELIC